MSAAANEINALQILEPIPRPEMEHLAQIVRETERRAPIDLMLFFPISRSEHALETNAFLELVYAHLAKLPENQVAKPGPLASPVYVGMLMRHRNQYVERAHARWRE